MGGVGLAWLAFCTGQAAKKLLVRVGCKEAHCAARVIHVGDAQPKQPVASPAAALPCAADRCDGAAVQEGEGGRSKTGYLNKC